MIPDPESVPTRSGPSRRTKIFRLTLFGLVSFLILGYCGIVGAYVYFNTKSAQHDVCCITPADWDAAYEDVTISGGDGVALAGWYMPPQDSANGAVIIVLHGYGGSRNQMWQHAALLTEGGYGVLMYDLRAHGESGGDHRAMGWPDVADVNAAVEWLKQRSEVEWIGIVGFSVGGQIAIRAAAENDSLRAVVGDGTGIATWKDVRESSGGIKGAFFTVTYALSDRLMALVTGEDVPTAVIDVIHRLEGRPLLLIAGGAEEYEEPTARAYYAAARDPKDIWVIDGAKHGGTWKANPQEYADRVREFFGAARDE